jgi:hypothetical protein
VKTEDLSKDEKSLLLMLECACVDYGGIYQPERLNDADRAILERWKKDGILDHGRVASEFITMNRRVWVRLSGEAMQAAQELRSEHYARMLANRNWLSTAEKRVQPEGKQ